MPEETPSAAALEAAEEATQPNVLLEAIDTAEPPDGPQLRIVVDAQDQPDRDRPIDATEAAIPDALEGGPSTVQIEEPQEIGEKAGGASLQQADKPTGGKPRREEKNRRRTLTAASRENRFVSDEKIVVPIVRNVYRNHAADYSRAYITRRFSVNSNIAQVLFEHNYDRIDYANYIVSLVIPSIAPQEISRRTNEALEALYTELEQKLDDRFDAGNGRQAQAQRYADLRLRSSAQIRNPCPLSLLHPIPEHRRQVRPFERTRRLSLAQRLPQHQRSHADVEPLAEAPSPICNRSQRTSHECASRDQRRFARSHPQRPAANAGRSATRGREPSRTGCGTARNDRHRTGGQCACRLSLRHFRPSILMTVQKKCLRHRTKREFGNASGPLRNIPERLFCIRTPAKPM